MNSIEILAATPPPKILPHWKLAQNEIVKLEDALGLPHQPTILNLARFTARVQELRLLLARQSQSRAPVAATPPASPCAVTPTETLAKIVARVYKRSLPSAALPEPERRAALATTIFQQRGQYPGCEADFAKIDFTARRNWRVSDAGSELTAAVFNQQQLDKLLVETSNAPAAKTSGLTGLDRTRANFELQAAKLLGRKLP